VGENIKTSFIGNSKTHNTHSRVILQKGQFSSSTILRPPNKPQGRCELQYRRAGWLPSFPINLMLLASKLRPTADNKSDRSLLSVYVHELIRRSQLQRHQRGNHLGEHRHGHHDNNSHHHRPLLHRQGKVQEEERVLHYCMIKFFSGGKISTQESRSFLCNAVQSNLARETISQCENKELKNVPIIL